MGLWEGAWERAAQQDELDDFGSTIRRTADLCLDLDISKTTSSDGTDRCVSYIATQVNIAARTTDCVLPNAAS